MYEPLCHIEMYFKVQPKPSLNLAGLILALFLISPSAVHRLSVHHLSVHRPSTGQVVRAE